MEVVNLLEFLNKSKDLYTLEYAKCGRELVNFLDLMTEDEQFTRNIGLGVMFVSQSSIDQYLIIDGLDRLLSLTLLLHAVCECYKKTSEKNDKAIRTIRNKYLLDGSKTKLHLAPKQQDIYNKIIYGERLSGKEKEHPMFVLLHNFWTQIKEEQLKAANIFAMLQKVTVFLADVDNVNVRDLYYTLNKNSSDLDLLLMVEDYLKNLGVEKYWNNIKGIFNSLSDLDLFFRDFFITKFSFKEYKRERLYEIFVNYFETMLQYVPEDTIMKKIERSAKLYKNLLNVTIENEDIKRAIIQIKMHNGEDTFAYILNIYEDYVDNNITESTFIEILTTIDEYLKGRQQNSSDVGFNELIRYLNAFITCK